MGTQRRAQRRALVLLVGAVTVALLTGLTAGPASARAVEVADPRGDMWRVVYNDGPDDVEVTRAPRQRNGDITALRVDHAPYRLGLTTRLAVLDTSSVEEVDVIHRIRRPDRAALQLAVTVRRQGRTLTALTGPDGLVACPDIRTAINRDRPSVRVTVPRRCLGRPEWVRASARTSVDDATDRYFSDTWGTRGLAPAVFTRRVPVG